MQAFWMVLGSMGAPTVRHATPLLAKKEAERLARIHTGQEFFILEAKAVVRKTDVTCTRLDNVCDPSEDYSGCPF